MTPPDRTTGDDPGHSESEEASVELEEAFEEELEYAAEELEAEDVGEKRHGLFTRLYRGETSFDFIGNRRWWFGVSALIILLGLVSLGTRGLNLGIDFKGGQSWLVPSQTLTVAEATSAVEAAGIPQPTVVQLTNQVNHTKQIQVQADLNSKPVEQRTAIENKVQDALAKAAHTSPNNVNFNDVGPTWGGQVTSKAIEALIVFFIAVTLYISIRFEFKMAVAALVNNDCIRIVLARPAVEAGEKLGFLPGDLAEKVNPYLRPLYDALHDMIDFEKATRLVQRGTIEVAPLAFMRGRTLNDSFVILDEAQNTTSEQMMMFLTRLGFGSKAVITGDVTQIDLAPGARSGLVEARDLLQGVEGIAFVHFTERDVVRHPLVQDIIRAYESRRMRRSGHEAEPPPA